MMIITRPTQQQYQQQQYQQQYQQQQYPKQKHHHHHNQQQQQYRRWWLFILFLLLIGCVLFIGQLSIIGNYNNLFFLDTNSSNNKNKNYNNTQEQEEQGQQYHIAIIVAGTLQRYMFESTIEHLLKPLSIDQGHKVDYYLSLTTAKAKPYRSNSGYMEHIHMDPIFTNGMIIDVDDDDVDDDSSNTSTLDIDHIEHIIRHRINEVNEHNTNNDNNYNNNNNTNNTNNSTNTSNTTTNNNNCQLRKLLLRHEINIDDNEYVINHRKIAKEQYPNDMDPDLRFPTLDLRRDRGRGGRRGRGGGSRQKHDHNNTNTNKVEVDTIQEMTSNANRNLLRLHYAVYELWTILLEVEVENHFQYDYVMFVRDDSLWLDDFHIQRLIDSSSSSTTTRRSNTKNFIKPQRGVVVVNNNTRQNQQKSSSSSSSSSSIVVVEEAAAAAAAEEIATAPDAYILSCDARHMNLHDEINDHIIISKRYSAHVFGDYFHQLFTIQDLVQRCSSSSIPSSSFHYWRILHHNPFNLRLRRGCSSEMLLKYIIVEINGLILQTVGQAFIPFERSVHLVVVDDDKSSSTTNNNNNNINNNNNKTIIQCYHKYCQSKQDSLHIVDDISYIQRCSKMKNIQF